VPGASRPRYAEPRATLLAWTGDGIRLTLELSVVAHRARSTPIAVNTSKGRAAGVDSGVSGSLEIFEFPADLVDVREVGRGDGGVRLVGTDRNGSRYDRKKAGFTVNTASAQGVANALQAKGTWKGRSNPQPGDAVTFRWDGSHGWADHVGIVEKIFQQNGKTYIQTIEGNRAIRFAARRTQRTRRSSTALAAWPERHLRGGRGGRGGGGAAVRGSSGHECLG